SRVGADEKVDGLPRADTGSRGEAFDPGAAVFCPGIDPGLFQEPLARARDLVFPVHKIQRRDFGLGAETGGGTTSQGGAGSEDAFEEGETTDPRFRGFRIAHSGVNPTTWGPPRTGEDRRGP